MSLYDYRKSQDIDCEEFSFCALIMAAMRKADSLNIIKLRSAFPDIWEELHCRYHSPGGLMPDELESLESVDNP